MVPVNGDVKWRCVIVCAILSVLLFERTVCVYTYDRRDLLHILQTVNCEYRPKLLYFSDDLSRDNTQTHTKGRTFQRDSTHRRSRKRGRRAGVLTRFRRRNLRPPLPAIVLTNARSLKNKTDELFQLMSFKREFKDASVLCITETWLDPLTPDIAVTAPGHTLFRADRCPVLSQKEKGGGVCFLVNQRWCNDAKLVSQSCSVELETLIINCRPFYSPREFSSVVLVGVYIPPEVNAAKAINQLADQILSVENANPDSVVIVVGDFNHTCPSKVLPRYKQHVDCSTRKDKTLDHCYTVYKGAYHASARAPLGKSDHNTVILIPAYRQKLKTVKPVKKTVKK